MRGRSETLLQNLGEEVVGAAVCILEDVVVKTMALIGIDVAITGEMVKAAHLDQFLRVSDRNEIVPLAMEDKQRGHPLDVLRENGWHAAIPFGNRINRDAL